MELGTRTPDPLVANEVRYLSATAPGADASDLAFGWSGAARGYQTDESDRPGRRRGAGSVVDRAAPLDDLVELVQLAHLVAGRGLDEGRHLGLVERQVCSVSGRVASRSGALGLLT